MVDNRMERFTVRSRRVMSLSQEEAENLHHDAIGTEHMLLGLLREEGGIAARVLAEVGVRYPQTRLLVKDVVKSTTHAKLELTPNTKKLLELAVAEARRHQQNFIGTEHLLMAVTRLPHSKAYTILKHLNVDVEDVYRRALDFSMNDPVMTTPTTPFTALAAIGFFSLAEQEAAQLRSPSVEPEHLLLALLADEDSAASKLMHELNLSLDRLRGMVQKIKRDLPARQVAGSTSTVIWSHDALQFLRMYTGYFPEPLLIVLVRDWWVLSDLWRQALLEPKQVQAALDRAQIGIVMRYPRHMSAGEYVQVNLNLLFPPLLRRKIKSMWSSIQNKVSGKKI
ncbi:MAG: Clp protease N-terminal domain-containing protein [Chloroflexota bacterium]